MRRLILPSGGYIEIPLPGSKGSLTIKQGSMLRDAAMASRVPVILVGIVIGVAIGATAMAWRHRTR
jgi:hypothetical protein